MYTNALMGTALDRRHVWRPAAKDGLERALEQDEYAALACECGEQEAIHEPDSEGQQHLRLVAVRDLGVETLADFLVHPGTSEQCARCAASTLGMEWPPEQAGVEVEDVEDPEYVAKEVHEQRAARMYEERYGDRDAVALEDGEVGDEIQALVEGKYTEVLVVRGEGENRTMAVYDGSDSYTCHPHEGGGSTDWFGRITDDLPSHPNARCSTVPQQDERTSDAADALRYAQGQYATFVEYGRTDGSDGAAGAPLVGASDPGTYAPIAIDPQQFSIDIDAQVEAAVDSVAGAAERAAKELERHRAHSVDLELTLTEDQAEDLRKEMGLADRAARDSR